MYGPHTNRKPVLYKEGINMRSPQDMTRLMEYKDTKRIFILEALEFIGNALDERLYSYDGGFSRSEVEIGWRDIVYYVFCFEYRNGKQVLVGWRGNKFKFNVVNKAVPDIIAYKSWREIYESLVADPYQVNEITDWFAGLKKELEIKGFKISNIYPFDSDSFHVRWNKND